ncbi:MAG: hypothetical protein NC217_02650 [Muribaculaceae bacterium]|nr:hypothetical protein [Muribaculaceae bacterium]
MNKKNNLVMMMAMMLSIVMMAMSSCSKSSHRNSEDDEEEKVSTFSEKAAVRMYEKYQDGTMTKSDYSECIDWMEEGLNALMDDMQKCINRSTDIDQFHEMSDKTIDKTLEKYDKLEDISKILERSDEANMGAANYKRWTRLQEKADERMQKLSEKTEEKFGNSEF